MVVTFYRIYRIYRSRLNVDPVSGPGYGLGSYADHSRPAVHASSQTALACGAGP